MNPFSRRHWLETAACGFGGLAASALANDDYGKPKPKPKEYRYTPTRFGAARRVIFLFMEGGPSQYDTFDYKPNLSGMKSPFKFIESGESGLPISEVFENVAAHADDLCLLNGMETSSSSHGQAETLIHTGVTRYENTPSLGSWAFYGLADAAQQLPGYVTINYGGRASNFGAGFLPSKYQGVKIEVGDSRRSFFGEAASVVPNAMNRHYTSDGQMRQIDFVQRMNQAYADVDLSTKLFPRRY
ncbi:MAG: DUF1501 domain-containing protein [Verrucomicrobiota bacterium]